MPVHTPMELLASILFVVAVLHTFSIKFFQHTATKYPEGSVAENFFHLLAEVEVVFGVWAGVLMLCAYVFWGSAAGVGYVESLNFTEPLFVFAIMAIASTRPVLQLASDIIEFLSALVPLPASVSFFLVTLIAGPLLGSLITEPAAMTVTALLLKRRYFDLPLSLPLRYTALGVLFVNISVGGVLSHFAAPPVVMVASVWNWDTPFMLEHFGWRATLAVVVNAAAATFLFRKELKGIPNAEVAGEGKAAKVPWWLVTLHCLFIFLVVFNAHHAVIFVGLFLFFLGLAAITQEYQDELKLKESLLVGFFLAGLVVLGGLQRWWLQPLLESLSAPSLYLGTTFLTAITDNAALTYLGSQVQGLSDLKKYALVAGAVSGGGLTVIANAPNPAGFSILRGSFSEGVISPLYLLLGAFIPTLIAMVCFWLIP